MNTTQRYGLTTYDLTDENVKYMDVFESTIGSGQESNLIKIDAALGGHEDAIGAIQSGYLPLTTFIFAEGNLYSASGVADYAGYQEKQLMLFSVDTSNTGPSTLNINASGEKPLRRYNDRGELIDLLSEEIKANQIYLAVFHEDSWVLIGGSPGSGSGGLTDSQRERLDAVELTLFEVLHRGVTIIPEKQKIIEVQVTNQSIQNVRAEFMMNIESAGASLLTLEFIYDSTVYLTLRQNLTDGFQIISSSFYMPNMPVKNKNLELHAAVDAGTATIAENCATLSVHAPDMLTGKNKPWDGTITVLETFAPVTVAAQEVPNITVGNFGENLSVTFPPNTRSAIQEVFQPVVISDPPPPVITIGVMHDSITVQKG